MSRTPRIVSFAGSTRRGSFNETILTLAEGHIRSAGVELDAVRLDDYPMPLYNADEHLEHGIPDTAHRLFERITAATAVLIASPEYNGGYTPLLKNTIDWVSRIDKLFLYPRLVGLIAVTPGKKAGASVLAQTEGMLESMFIELHDSHGIGRCREIIIDGVLTDADEHHRLAEWVDGFVTAVRRHADRPERAAP